jgi:hypothetical protein
MRDLALTDATGRGAGSLLVDFHVDVQAFGYFDGLCIGCDSNEVDAGTYAQTFSYTQPQLLDMNATMGRATWAVPPLEDVDLQAFVAGQTPGTQMYHRVLAESSPLSVASESAPRVLPGVGAFVAVYAAGLGIAAIVARYARKFEGVPDLE